MDLSLNIENVQRQLALAAEAGGDEARALGERLVAPLEAALRLTLLDVLAAAAEEITCELAPGSVEVRLRGRDRDPELVVTLAPGELPGYEVGSVEDHGPPAPAPVPVDGDEGAMCRINLRMPDHLKARIERVAGGEGLSVNAWLVRAAAAALQRADPERQYERRAPKGAQRYTGWVR